MVAVSPSCEHKLRYTSKKAARIALRRHRGSFADLHCYHCPECHGWHIGHREKKR